jgi:protein gp37
MSDLFHDEIPFSFLEEVFYEMEHTPRHTYQILTKRHERLFEVAPKLKWTDNIWIGVSVENQDYVNRINALRCVSAKVRFLSGEPLLGPLKLDLTGIHWVIVGGESGQRHRPICAEWVREIRDQCNEADVPFFFKQWGGQTSKTGGRLLDGKTYDAMPPLIS